MEELFGHIARITGISKHANTAEKLEGTPRGVDADPLPFLPLFLFRLHLLLHPFPSLHSSFLLPSNSARTYGKHFKPPTVLSENDSQLQKSEGTKYTGFP